MRPGQFCRAAKVSTVRSRIKNILKKTVLAGVASIALLLVLAAVVSQFYEKAVVRYLQNYLKDHLLTEISLGEISFHVIRSFPNASVTLRDVTILSGSDFSPAGFRGSSGDTLMKAGRVVVQFNLFKLLRKEFELRKIEASGGYVQILFDRKNRHNLNIWKSSGEKGGSYPLHLRSIQLTGMQVNLISLAGPFRASASISRTVFRGTYSQGILSGVLKGNMRLQPVVFRTDTLLTNSDLQYDLMLTHAHSHFRVRKSTLRLNGVLAHIEGEYAGGAAQSVDMKLSVPRFAADELLAVIPDVGQALQEKYTITGQGNLTMNLSGTTKKGGRLMAASTFQLGRGSIRNKRNRSAMDQVEVAGTAAGIAGGSMEVTISRFMAASRRGTLTASAGIQTGTNGHFSTSIQSSIDLNDLLLFFNLDSVIDLKGSMTGNLTAAGPLASFTSDSAFRIIGSIDRAYLKVNEVTYRHKNKVFVEDLSGIIQYSSQTIHLDSLSASLQGNKLQMNGNIRNLQGYLAGTSNLRASLRIWTDRIDLARVFHASSSDRGSPALERKSIFPERIEIIGTLETRFLEMGKFTAEQTEARFQLMGDSLFVNHYIFKFPDGVISGDALIHSYNGNLAIACHARPRDVNIQRLFVSFNNFSQRFITDQNVMGKLNGDIRFSATWDSAYRFVPALLEASARFEIQNGQLIQFEPMLRLSKYMDVDELRHVKFSTLRNEIFIDNREITIPEMDIHSSAFNISVAGRHGFDNRFDYRLRVLLSEVLFNKARRKQKEMDEFLMEAPTDETTIPLIVAGTPDQFDVKLDRRRVFDLKKKPGFSSGTGVANQKDPALVERDEKESKRDAQTTRQEQRDFEVTWEEEEVESEE